MPDCRVLRPRRPGHAGMRHLCARHHGPVLTKPLKVQPAQTFWSTVTRAAAGEHLANDTTARRVASWPHDDVQLTPGRLSAPGATGAIECTICPPQGSAKVSP